MFRFTIRELVLLTLVAAIGVGWFREYRNRISERSLLEHLATSLWAILEDDGWAIEWDRENNRVRVRSHDGRSHFNLTPDSFNQTPPYTLTNDAETSQMPKATAASPDEN